MKAHKFWQREERMHVRKYRTIVSWPLNRYEALFVTPAPVLMVSDEKKTSLRDIGWRKYPIFLLSIRLRSSRPLQKRLKCDEVRVHTSRTCLCSLREAYQTRYSSKYLTRYYGADNIYTFPNLNLFSLSKVQ